MSESSTSDVNRARITVRLASLVVATSALLSACNAPPRDGRLKLEEDLAGAREALANDPESELGILWVGRRQGYLGRHEDAIATFTHGLALHPTSARLLRFRGHRFISLRRFDDAIEDLERARSIAALQPDEVEPDGAPNAAGIPRGTLRSNIDYHLGLALFLRGHFERAARVYDEGFALARANDDRLVSHTYWTVLTLWKLGRDDEARALLEPITERMDVLENHGYHALLRYFQGAITLDELDTLPQGASATEQATRAFGGAMKLVHDGDTLRGKQRLANVAALGPSAAFACIAAEVELGRL